MPRARPTTVTSRRPATRTRKPEASAPTAVAPASAPRASRCSSGPPYRTRSTKTAAADDRGREGVAGQQRDERRGAERQAAEQPRLEERVGAYAGRDDGEAIVATTGDRARTSGTVAGSRSVPAISVVPMRVSPTSPLGEREPEQERARGCRSTRPARRVPAGGRGPGRGRSATIADRDVDVEDPAPGRRQERGERPVAMPALDEGVLRRGRTPGSRPRRTARRPCPGTSARR